MLTRKLFLQNLEAIRKGSLALNTREKAFLFGQQESDLKATVNVHDDRFFTQAVLGGNVGLGESFMDGDWTSPDLVSVVRLAVRNLSEMKQDGWLFSNASRVLDTLRHRSRKNSVSGSRKNIEAHYDLSNDFFELFLDRSLMYSSALYESAGDSLERAQSNKLRRICEKLQLTADDHVLEIGTGWGGFAEYAVRNYGCQITTTTISREQYAFASDRLADLPGVTLLNEDYRNLRGTFDKLVSIEMFEAVGLPHYDDFFSTCDRLLKPDGTMVLQTIAMNEQTYPGYRGRADWIQKYIFPGGELASVSEILQSLARVTKLLLYHAEDFGTHYARTLAAWRERFHGALPEVRALGFDDRFIRMWDYYLAYCEGAFLERHVQLFQIALTKSNNSRVLFGEPWAEARVAVSGE